MKLKDVVIEVVKEVYGMLGAGYDENIYHRAFEAEMRLKGISYEAEKPVQVTYKGHAVGVLYADIYVWQGDEKVLVEFKASSPLADRTNKSPEKVKEIAQVSHYYQQLNLPKETTVLLINFPFPANGEPEVFEVN